MLLYFDLDKGRLVTSPGSGDSLAQLDFKRGDTLPVILRFIRGLTVTELAAGATGSIGLKTVGNFDGSFLAADIGWTKTGTSTATIYTFVLDLNTVALNTALGVGAAADVASLPVNFELEFVESGNTTSSQTVLGTVYNDVIRGAEEAATTAPSVALRIDETVQTLTLAQKAQALANLGIPNYADLAAANAVLSIGMIYFDLALQKLNTATA
jgi:hypothetical protein